MPRILDPAARREHALAQMRAWYHKNKDKKKESERKKAWYAKNRKFIVQEFSVLSGGSSE